MNRTPNRLGFTLIEMLVVVGIIGVLSSVLLTALGPARDKAKDSRIIQQVNQVRALAETYYNGTYDQLQSIDPDMVGEIEDPNLKALADDIALQGGGLVIVKNAPVHSTAYIMWSRLNQTVGVEPDLQPQYYCLESGGKSAFVTEEPEGMTCSQ